MQVPSLFASFGSPIVLDWLSSERTPRRQLLRSADYLLLSFITTRVSAGYISVLRALSVDRHTGRSHVAGTG